MSYYYNVKGTVIGDNTRTDTSTVRRVDGTMMHAPTSPSARTVPQAGEVRRCCYC